MFTHQSLFLESDRLILIFWNSDKNKIIVLDAETTFRFGTQLINEFSDERTFVRVFSGTASHLYRPTANNPAGNRRDFRLRQ